MDIKIHIITIENNSDDYNKQFCNIGNKLYITLK